MIFDTFFSRVACNSYIVGDENTKCGFLVDPGYNEQNKLIKHIEKTGVIIKAILITHGHYDHISALKEICEKFPDATVYINFEEEEFLTNPKLNLTAWKNDTPIYNLSYKPKKLILLSDGDNFKICGFSIKCIHTPFHTIGSSCFYLQKESILFSGDALFYTTIGRTDLPTGSNKTVNSSLSKLLSLPDETKVYPGHGVATKLEREKKYNSYLRNI